MSDMLKMPDGRMVEQGSKEDKATWWTCTKCMFFGPHVGMDRMGNRRCLASCGGCTSNPNIPRLPQR